MVGFDSALLPCLTPAREDLRERRARPSKEAHLEESHPIRRLALVALVALCALAAAAALTTPSAGARAAQLQ